MKHAIALDAAAGLDAAWQALTDVASWPRWTASMTSVERLDDGPLRSGSRARIRQPGFPPLIWEVSDLRAGAEFTWVARSPGVRTAGRHLLEANPDGTTRITLFLDQTGPLGLVVGALTGAKTRRFLALEVAGLKDASEAAERARGGRDSGTQGGGTAGLGDGGAPAV